MYDAIIFSDVTDPIVTSLSLGPYKCAHVLRQVGYSCLVINHLSTWSQDELCDLLDDAIGQNTRLVGFSTTFMNLFVNDAEGFQISTEDIGQSSVFPQGPEFEAEIMAHMRDLNPGIKTMVGGTKTGPNYSNRNIDYVLLGYSEISVVNLMRHLDLGEPLNKAVRNVWGRWIVDDRFAKDYDFPTCTMQWLPEDVINHRVLPLEIARGCIFRCKFCSYPMNGKQQLDFVRTPDTLYQELNENYQRYGIRHYIIVDDTFNDHIEKLESLLSMVERLDFQPVFWAYHRLDLICTRPETLDLLYRIGVRSMYFGIETLHQPTGRTIGKGFDRNKQIEMMQHMKSRYPEISQHGSFIVGLPYEPVDSIQRTYEQIMSQHIPLDSWIFQELKIYLPEDNAFNSEITLTPEKFGYENLGIADSKGRYINWRNEHMDHDTAMRISREYMAASHQASHFRVSGHTAMYLTTMNIDFDQSRQTSHYSMDWHGIRTKIKPVFDQCYRTELINHVRKTKYGHGHAK
jgi:hypothetical protein